MQSRIGQLGQLRQIFADEFAFGVKFFALAGGVEYPEVRLRIAPTGAGPLPAAVVGRQVKVIQLFSK